MEKTRIFNPKPLVASERQATAKMKKKSLKKHFKEGFQIWLDSKSRNLKVGIEKQKREKQKLENWNLNMET